MSKIQNVQEHQGAVRGALGMHKSVGTSEVVARMKAHLAAARMTGGPHPDTLSTVVELLESVELVDRRVLRPDGPKDLAMAESESRVLWEKIHGLLTHVVRERGLAPLEREVREPNPNAKAYRGRVVGFTHEGKPMEQLRRAGVLWTRHEAVIPASDIATLEGKRALLNEAALDVAEVL